ncbi:hypothetical protein [Segatella salivae]|uniref:hypothetical protein n=1 Tax=Segatella salivae TaxID=228604 RepID=UPI0028E34F1E|nr:hypothetical protein [Segatella salivae]
MVERFHLFGVDRCRGLLVQFCFQFQAVGPSLQQLLRQVQFQFVYGFHQFIHVELKLQVMRVAVSTAVAAVDLHHLGDLNV